MSGNHYIVGLEPAVEELLRRTDDIDNRLTNIHSLLEKLAMTFEENVQLLINYAKALKDQVTGLENGEAEATIAALRAEVVATAAALSAAQDEIAADTAQEEALNPQILELLAPPAVVEPDPVLEPAPELPVEEEPVVGDPMPESEGPPFGTPGTEVLNPEPEPISSDDMVA